MLEIKENNMSATKAKQIFIVDDNEIYSMMLDYILSKNSIYKFVSFKSGEECIENLYLNPAIVILDYGLPGINGYETLLKIKKYNSKIHVVILTSHEDETLKKKLLAADADDVVLKQGRGETQIIEKIEEILNEDKTEGSNYRGATKVAMYCILIALLLTLVFIINNKN